MRRLVAVVLIAAALGSLPDTAEARSARSRQARRTFMKQTGYPHGRPGYVIDHIVPLACGGPDHALNMQWQTIAEAKEKDRWERKACGK